MLITRHWFAIFTFLLVLWVGWNLISGNEYDDSLRPIYWLIDELI